MPVFQTAHYRVNESAMEAVRAAIVEFVEYVAAHEPGSRVYAAWQQKDDPTRFVHLFEFAGEGAQTLHGESQAVRAFEAVYLPELADGPVAFTDYVQIASDTAP